MGELRLSQFFLILIPGIRPYRSNFARVSNLCRNQVFLCEKILDFVWTFYERVHGTRIANFW